MGGELASPLSAAVHDADLGRTRARQLDRDRPRGATCAQQHDPRAPRLGNSGQRRQEAQSVGVLPDQSAVPDHHAVHRANQAGGFGDLVEMLDHGDLVRKRAVET